MSLGICAGGTWVALGLADQLCGSFLVGGSIGNIGRRVIVHAQAIGNPKGVEAPCQCCVSPDVWGNASLVTCKVESVLLDSLFSDIVKTKL